MIQPFEYFASHDYFLIDLDQFIRSQCSCRELYLLQLVSCGGHLLTSSLCKRKSSEIYDSL